MKSCSRYYGSLVRVAFPMRELIFTRHALSRVRIQYVGTVYNGWHLARRPLKRSADYAALRARARAQYPTISFIVLNEPVPPCVLALIKRPTNIPGFFNARTLRAWR